MTDETPGNVFRLPDDLVTPPEKPKPSPPGRLHGFSIAGMSICALLGTLAMFAFITITWPESVRRYIVGTFIFSIVGFVSFASAAIFSAARDTYPRKPDR